MSITIIGSGLAGLSAALTLAEQGTACTLVSAQASERAQSVMAEGGINASLNTMGEDDTVANPIEDTLRGGVWLADPNAVRGLCNGAPEIVRKLYDLGVPFSTNQKGIVQRNFGGQKKKRTAFGLRIMFIMMVMIQHKKENTLSDDTTWNMNVYFLKHKCQVKIS